MADNQNETGIDEMKQEEDTIVQEEGAETDAWQDELPPDDDFHDQGEPVEESLDDVAGEEVQDAPQDRAKRGKAILFGALAVGAVFIGGLAYLQLSPDQGSSGPVPLASVMDMNELKAANAGPLPKADTALTTPVNATTSSQDIDSLFSAAQTQLASKTALPNNHTPEIVEEKPIQGMSSDLISSSVSAPDVPSSPVIPSPAPEKKSESTASIPVPEIQKIETIPVPQAGTAVPSAPQPLPVSLGAGTAPSAHATQEAEARIKLLTQQLDTLQASMDQLSRKNTELLAQIETMRKTPPQPVVEKQVRGPSLETSAVVVQMAGSGKNEKLADPMATSIDLGGMQPENPSITPVKNQEEKRLAPKKERIKKTSKKKSEAKREGAGSKSSSGWVLRAATPEAAWVSAGRQTQELRRVAVGEDLPGIGMVKDIRQNGDRWEIVGSKGVLK